ncbi:unnamed protein product [Closterium sp. Naga37s-1]|nr:unnamed protein product [Closterium sp. Naga37s-1]
MPPKSTRAKPVADAPAGGGDPASKTSPGKGKEVIGNLPSEAEVTAGISGLTIEEKLKALATVSSDDSFIEDDSDEELKIDTAKSSYPHLRFTAILLFPVIPSREVASVILTEDVAYLRKKASSPQLLEVYFKNVPADIPPELVKEVMVLHPLRIWKQSAFAEGHCFHRVLHPVTGADTDKIKGLVVQHAGDRHRWRHEFRHQLLAASLRASPLTTPLLLDAAFVLISTGSNREEWLCTLECCGKAHGKSFMAAADHVTSASHLLGLEKLGAAIRSSLERLGRHVIRKEYQI